MILSVFSGTSTACAAILAYVGFFIADTSVGAGIALSLSGINAIAALLTGYAALRGMKNKPYRRKHAKKVDADSSISRGST